MSGVGGEVCQPAADLFGKDRSHGAELICEWENGLDKHDMTRGVYPMR